MLKREVEGVTISVSWAWSVDVAVFSDQRVRLDGGYKEKDKIKKALWFISFALCFNDDLK